VSRGQRGKFKGIGGEWSNKFDRGGQYLRQRTVVGLGKADVERGRGGNQCVPDWGKRRGKRITQGITEREPGVSVLVGRDGGKEEPRHQKEKKGVAQYDQKKKKKKRKWTFRFIIRASRAQGGLKGEKTQLRPKE